MNRIGRGLLAVAVLALLVFAVIRVVATNGPVAETAAPGLEGLVVPGAGVIRWSPDATKLAVLAAGELVIVQIADGKELARRGTTIADVAWIPDATRVVAVEGPIPTGQIVALRSDGAAAGTTALRPSIAFGLGRGLAVDGKGTQAAAVATRRDAVGGATYHDLALIQLQSGATRVFVTEGQEESNPVFVDETTIAYASVTARGKSRLHTVDATTGEVSNLGAIDDGPYGTLASGEIVVGERTPTGGYRVDAVGPTGDRRVLGELQKQQRPVAIDRFGTRALVRRFGGFQGTRLAIAVLSK